MGATDFATYATGKTLREACQRAAESAAYEYGHNPYTGTIASTDYLSCQELRRPRDVTPSEIMSAFFGDDPDSEKKLEAWYGVSWEVLRTTCWDKWGGNLAIPLEDGEIPTYLNLKPADGERAWLIFGSAPC